MITVFIARFGHDEIELNLDNGTTVAAAFAASGIEMTGREQMYVDGIQALPGSVLENGDVISIVTPKQAGSNVTVY